MIKKLIGIIVATAVIVIIVIAAIRRDNFQSMVLRDEIEDQTYPEPVASQQPAALAPGETETTDSVSVEVIDSLRWVGNFVGQRPGNGCPADRKTDGGSFGPPSVCMHMPPFARIFLLIVQYSKLFCV